MDVDKSLQDIISDKKKSSAPSSRGPQRPRQPASNNTGSARRETPYAVSPDIDVSVTLFIAPTPTAVSPFKDGPLADAVSALLPAQPTINGYTTRIKVQVLAQEGGRMEATHEPRRSVVPPLGSQVSVLESR